MTMPFAPNQLVAEHLTLIRRIGEGGMGSVWLAFDAAKQREVAVKFLSERFTTDDMARARFFREARLGSSVRSPHVAEVLECALLSDGTPYIEMEFVRGEELSTRIQRKGALSIAEARSVIEQVGEALAALHNVGIVHRDVKPNNIVVNEVNGKLVAKLVDLGIAKESDGADDLTQTGTTMGTPIYMSPEQMFDSRDAGTSADLWALAVVAYECLTGALPFQGDTFGSVCIAVHSGRYKRPTATRSDLAASADEWFARAFARDKEARIDSIAALRESFSSMCVSRTSSPAAADPSSLLAVHIPSLLAADATEAPSPPSSRLALGRAVREHDAARVTVRAVRRRSTVHPAPGRTETTASRVQPRIEPSLEAVSFSLHRKVVAKHHDVAFLVSKVRGDDPIIRAKVVFEPSLAVRPPPTPSLRDHRCRDRQRERDPRQEAFAA